MFQNWANYLLGAVTNNTDQGATAEGVERHQTRLISRLPDEVEDADWVLVDQQDSEGNSEVSSVDSLDIEWDTQDHRTSRSGLLEVELPLPAQLTRRTSNGTLLRSRSSSESSLPNTTTLEESWFLTPPPCFTSTGPIIMETSPMENLLIEHPSMSVYQHNQPRSRHAGVTLSTGDTEEEEEEFFQVEDVEDEHGNQVAVVHLVAPSANDAPAPSMHQRERQCYKHKQAQRVQIQKASQPLKRAFLRRNNKAREVNCRNQRQRRGQRSQGANRSHANNNRKCC